MTQKAFLIAIAGGSGSGKSTIASGLRDALGPGKTVTFLEDNYYWPLSRYGPFADDAQRQERIAGINYDDPSSKDEAMLVRDLRALKEGKTVHQPVYNFDSHDRVQDQVHTLEPAPIILFEGIHTLSISDLKLDIDLSIYVDTPDDLRLARRIRRDVTERDRSVESVLRQYLSTVRSAHYSFTYPAKFEADLVIADDGLPAYGKIAPDQAAIRRMTAPVLDRLRSLGKI